MKAKQEPQVGDGYETLGIFQIADSSPYHNKLLGHSYRKRTAAFVNMLVHLFADFFSTHSLPLPLTTVVYDSAGREFRKFVHDLYQGGFHLRHVAIGGIEVLLSHTAIEVWLWMQYGSEGVRLTLYP
ncbi:MAG: hypothetical protein ACLQPD_18330 [Desulfomonilaceae bacterium]